MPTFLCSIRGLLLGSNLVLLLVVGGCQTARMPLPEALSQAEQMPVRGRDGWKIRENLQFGPYRVHTIERSWVRGPDLAVNEVLLNRRTQQYAFALREDGADQWRTTCEATLRRVAVGGGGVEVALADRSALTCTLQGPASSWTLALAETHGDPFAGTLTGAGATWQVAGTAQLQGGWSAGAMPTGYEIRDGRAPVAAVEVINAGRVWMGDAVAPGERAVLAAAAAALLLVEDLRGHLQDDATS